MKKNRSRIRGTSYKHRMQRVLEIYNAHINEGLSTREILRRYIQPEFPISESTLYNYFDKELEGMDRPEEPGLFDELEDDDNR